MNLFNKKHYDFFVNFLKKNIKFLEINLLENLTEELKKDNSKFKKQLFYEKILKEGKNDK